MYFIGFIIDFYLFSVWGKQMSNKKILNIFQTIYDSLLDEIKNSGVDPRQLWQLWHGDSHVIADDKRKWKKECPTFTMIVDKIADYFHMDVKATRLNW